MALIKNKKEFVQAVGLVVETDMSIVNEMFPSVQLHMGEEIEYDSATVEGVAPSYNSFASTAKVIQKDGKDIVTLKPVNFNNAISKGVIDANASKFGQNEYGDGMVDAQMESALNGVAKLHLNRLVATKALAYEALTTHKIVGGYIGINGVEDIEFNVPAANKEVFDGTTLKYWSNSASTPLDDMVRAYKAMKIKPTRVIMNDATYSNFYDNAQVATFDNVTTGTKKNFTVNENIDPSVDFFRAGRINYKGITLDVYVERGVRYTGSGYVPFMPNGYVVYGSPIGEMHYGGIPVADTNGIRNIAAEYDVSEVIESNPPQHHLVYRSAPLPVLKNGHAYFSQKVEA